SAAALVGAIFWLASGPINRALAWFFRGFNRWFGRTTDLYTRSVGKLLRVSALVLIVYGGLLWLTYEGFMRTPTGFIPQQDKGYLLVNVQLPDSASVSRTEQVMERIEGIAGKTPGVRHTVAIAGQSILLNANAPNFGAMYVMLDEFRHRLRPELSGDAIAERLREVLRDEVRDGLINIFAAPPVEGL